MSSTTITMILNRLEKDQRDLFNQWQKKGRDEIDSIISAILREQPPAPAAESSRGKPRLLQEGKGISYHSIKEIKEIVNRTLGRAPPTMSRKDLQESFKKAFLAQGKPPDEAARMAEIAAGPRNTGGRLI